MTVKMTNPKAIGQAPTEFSSHRLGEFTLVTGPSHIAGRPDWTRYQVSHPAQATIMDWSGVLEGGNAEDLLRQVVEHEAAQTPADHYAHMHGSAKKGAAAAKQFPKMWAVTVARYESAVAALAKETSNA